MTDQPQTQAGRTLLDRIVELVRTIRAATKVPDSQVVPNATREQFEEAIAAIEAEAAAAAHAEVLQQMADEDAPQRLDPLVRAHDKGYLEGYGQAKKDLAAENAALRKALDWTARRTHGGHSGYGTFEQCVMEVCARNRTALANPAAATEEITVTDLIADERMRQRLAEQFEAGRKSRDRDVDEAVNDWLASPEGKAHDERVQGETIDSIIFGNGPISINLEQVIAAHPNLLDLDSPDAERRLTNALRFVPIHPAATYEARLIDYMRREQPAGEGE